MRASLSAGAKDVLKIKAAFSNGDQVPDAAPEVRIALGDFEFRAPGGQFTRKRDRYRFNQKLLGSRKVTLDYAKGVVTISLAGVELGSFEKGSVPVFVSIAFGEVRFADVPMLSGNGKSLKY